jgi:hypothetical protein
MDFQKVGKSFKENFREIPPANYAICICKCPIQVRFSRKFEEFQRKLSERIELQIMQSGLLNAMFKAWMSRKLVEFQRLERCT